MPGTEEAGQIHAPHPPDLPEHLGHHRTYQLLHIRDIFRVIRTLKKWLHQRPVIGMVGRIHLNLERMITAE